MAVFRVVAPCRLIEVTDVSEMLAAFIIRENLRLAYRTVSFL
jgi:hypothetical protein